MPPLPKVYFEKLLDSCPDIVIAVDVRGEIVFYNDGARKTLGYSTTEIRGRHVATVYPTLDEARRVMAAMRSEHLEERGKLKNFESTFVTKQGEHIPVLISGAIIYDDRGCEMGSIGFAKDLREIRRRDQLATLGEIAVGLAHEINNPLEVICNNLNMLSDFLRRQCNDEQYLAESEHLESTQHEVGRVQDIVNRIVEMASDGEYGTREYLPGTLMTDLTRREGEDTVQRSPATAGGGLDGLQILVADDDLGICHSLRDMLQHEGCHVEIATSGLSALRLVDTGRFDLVLSDVVMPDLDGYDLFMEVRKRHPALPLILMTAYYYDRDHVIKRSKLEGLEDVVFKKPIDPVRLKGLIRSSCRREHEQAGAAPRT